MKVLSVTQYTSKTGSLCFATICPNDILKSRYTAKQGNKVLPDWFHLFSSSVNSTGFKLIFTYN